MPTQFCSAVSYTDGATMQHIYVKHHYHKQTASFSNMAAPRGNQTSSLTSVVVIFSVFFILLLFFHTAFFESKQTWHRKKNREKRQRAHKKKKNPKFDKTKAAGIREARKGYLGTSCFHSCVTNPKVESPGACDTRRIALRREQNLLTRKQGDIECTLRWEGTLSSHVKTKAFRNSLMSANSILIGYQCMFGN